MSRGQRRLAAVMFTDMVGYTALGQKNEALSLALVEEQRNLIRPILARHGGREIKTIGDAFLVEFPNALEAVRCAYDIQRAAREFGFSLPEDRRIHLRVGVHLGDVVESLGDISGDAVNVASRIEPLAEDGGVAISRQVYDHVHNKFELPLVSQGTKVLKNIATPMEIFEIQMPWGKETPTSAMPLDPRRVAVLPFANMSPDPNDAYFADGITEEIISTVSSISGFGVISRTSVMGYKGTTKSVGEIGSELKVGSILEGSIRKESKRIRITAQLIDTNTDTHLWAQVYDRELDNVFAVQSDIARQVAGSLAVKILPAERQRMDRTPTHNTEAYDLYLQGRYQFLKFTKEGFDVSIERYRKALQVDPEFALAYEGMADTHLWFGFLGLRPEEQTYPIAKEYAEKALRLDDSLAESHYILGRILVEYFWSLDEGEAEFRRAIDLDPSNPTVRLAYSWLLASGLEDDRATFEAEKAVQLDPKSEVAWREGSYTYYLLGRFDLGIERGLKAIELSPEDPVAHLLASLSYIFVPGQQEAAIREATEATDLANNHAYYRANLAGVYGIAGRTEEAKNLLRALTGPRETENIPAVMVAWAFISVGDIENFFKWYEKAIAERSSYIVYMRNDPLVVRTGMVSEPRFKALMEKAGLGNRPSGKRN